MFVSHHRSRRTSVLVLGLLLSWWASPASAQDLRTKALALPSLSELRSGWNVLRPGGDTKCAKGGEYALTVRPDDADKLLVWFEGGGACWTGEACNGEQFYRAQLDSAAVTAPRNQGIFDQTNPANPFAGYSTVVVRYCTGDVHLGDHDATYTARDDKGESRKVTIHHRGQVNALTVLRWVQATFPGPREIFVSGTSGGAYATPFYASLLARHYPQARVVGLADSALTTLPAPDNHQWGFPGAVRRHAGWEQFPENWRVSDVLITAARTVPRLQLLQFNHAHDAQMQFRLRQIGDRLAVRPTCSRSFEPSTVQSLGRLRHSDTSRSAVEGMVRSRRTPSTFIRRADVRSATGWPTPRPASRCRVWNASTASVLNFPLTSGI